MLIPFKIVGLLLALFTVLLSGTASAQALGIGYAKESREGGFALQVELPFGPAHVRGGSVGFHAGGSRGYLRRSVQPLPPRWVPGHYESVPRTVWVPGAVRREWVPAQYATHVDACGRRVQVLVRAGHWATVHEPGHYEQRAETVWVPGHWVHGG